MGSYQDSLDFGFINFWLANIANRPIESFDKSDIYGPSKFFEENFDKSDKTNQLLRAAYKAGHEKGFACSQEWYV